MDFIEKLMEETDYSCHWHKNIVCEFGRECQDCWYMPADDDKPNGQKTPVPIAWETDFAGGTMPICPACGEIPYSLDRCTFCGQKLIKDERAKEWEKPPEIERMDCFMCGGKNTMELTRSIYNGHRHGRCTACGARIME